MTITRLIQLVFLIGMLLTGASAHAGAIALRPSARIEAPRPVTLADIADLTGEDAQIAGSVIIEPDVATAARGRAWAEITIEQVERALKSAEIPMGRLAISGSTCYLRFGVIPEINKPDPAKSAPKREPTTIDLNTPTTVRTRIAAALCSLCKVENDSLRVLFEDKDEDVLSMSATGRRIAVEPMTSAGTTRAILAVRVYEGDQLAINRTIPAIIQIKRGVLVMTKDVRRGSAIDSDAVTQEDRWMEPGGAPPILELKEVIGSLAQTRLETGSVLREHDVEALTLIERGEMVDVLCLSGGIEVKARARAMKDGKKGDRIELRMEGSKKSFQGRVDGPSRVVMNMDDSSAGETKDSQ